MEESKKQEKQIGIITHYFDKIGVGVIDLTDGDVKAGETLRIQGSKTDFEQTITSMQVDHQDVAAAFKGDAVGMKMDNPVKENDVVYKVLEG